MTKQEGIREMTKNYLVGCIHGATASYASLSGYDKSTVDFETDELLEEQSKQGLVLKVERELPVITWNSDDPLYDIAFQRGIAEGMGKLLKAGYEAVVPLIEGE